MSARYSRLSNPSSIHDPDGELEAAFELGDDEEELLNDRPSSRSLAPVHGSRAASTTTRPTTVTQRLYDPPATPGGYDFERQDYDFPPPGSPPPPTSRALPNDFGNSNGQLPTAPVASQPPQPSFFRRAMGVLLPTAYSRVSTSDSSSHPVGGGIENDGVFANVMAKPQVGRVVTTEDGNVYVVPEDSQKEMPPTYAEAQADAVPPYWETTVHAPASLDPSADMIIDDLPTGNFAIFAVNFFISWFFQFVGFFLTYMLHTSHASKFGSRAGLGITLIQYGFYSRAESLGQEQEAAAAAAATTTTGTTSSGFNTIKYTYATENGTSAAAPPEAYFSQTSRDWLSFLFMTLGWFLLLSSCVGFWRVKRWERSLRAPPADPTSPEDIERDQVIRRNIANVFGIPIDEEPHDVSTLTPAQQASLAAEVRLTRDLRAAGLI